MTVENIIRPKTGLERIVDNLGAADAVDKLEAFVALAQKDPTSAKLLIKKADIAGAVPLPVDYVQFT